MMFCQDYITIVLSQLLNYPEFASGQNMFYAF